MGFGVGLGVAVGAGVAEGATVDVATSEGDGVNVGAGVGVGVKVGDGLDLAEGEAKLNFEIGLEIVSLVPGNTPLTRQKISPSFQRSGIVAARPLFIRSLA